MNNLKEFSNLYGFIKRRQRGPMTALIIILVLFILSFVTIPLMDGVPLFPILFFIMLAIVGAAYLASRSTAKKLFACFTPDELARIDQDIPSIQMKDGCGVTRDAVIFGKGMLYPVKNILWIYKHVSTTRLYGVIPVSKDSFLVIAGKDKKRRSCKIKNKSDVIEFLRDGLSQYRKGIFYGYSEELDKLYLSDIQKMISMSQEHELQNTEMSV